MGPGKTRGNLLTTVRTCARTVNSPSVALGQGSGSFPVRSHLQNITDLACNIKNKVWTFEEIKQMGFFLISILCSFYFFCQHSWIKSHLGNINSHFTFSPNAGSNVTRLLLASHFDYAGGLDKIWDFKLLVYITDDNLLSGRRSARALVETGTVTLSVKVTPHPTSIVTTAARVRVRDLWPPALALTAMEPLTPKCEAFVWKDH